MKTNQIFIMFFIVASAAITGCNNNSQNEISNGDSSDNTTKKGASYNDDGTSYKIVLYDDVEGDLFTPEGGRICGVEKRKSNDEIEFRLTKSIRLLGNKTDYIYIYNERLLSNFSDYLKYSSFYEPDTTLGVPIKKYDKNGHELYAFHLTKKQIEQFNIRKHYTGANSNGEYTIIFYNDDSGHLFDDKGERICGLKKWIGPGFKLNKTVSMYNESVEELYIENGKLYTSNDDRYADLFPLAHKTEFSKSKAHVSVKDEGDAVIYKFSKKKSAPERILAETSKTNDNGQIKENNESTDNNPIILWLQGEWGYILIDPTFYEMHYTSYNFKGNRYAFSMGLLEEYEQPYNYQKYYVKGNIIYRASSNTPIFKIDERRNCLIDNNGNEFRKNWLDNWR